MDELRSEIREIVDRETRGWETKDVTLLLSVFHPDMVWPWPKTPKSHDPMEWRLVLGRFDPGRWGRRWRSAEGDESHWKGRVCKVYSKVDGEWKMTMHTGVLEYR